LSIKIHAQTDATMAEIANDKAERGLVDSAPGKREFDRQEDVDLQQNLGYKPELGRVRSLNTILFQSLAIIAVPFGEGTALTSAVIGGGQLPYFVGWIIVSILDECIAISLAELASRFPTSAGPYYWQVCLVQNII
jgi:amino acid permease